MSSEKHFSDIVMENPNAKIDMFSDYITENRWSWLRIFVEHSAKLWEDIVIYIKLWLIVSKKSFYKLTAV